MYALGVTHGPGLDSWVQESAEKAMKETKSTENNRLSIHRERERYTDYRGKRSRRTPRGGGSAFKRVSIGEESREKILTWFQDWIAEVRSVLSQEEECRYATQLKRCYDTDSNNWCISTSML